MIWTLKKYARRTAFAFTVVCAVASSGAAQDTPYHIEADVVYGHKDGMALTLDVFRPAVPSNGAGVLYMVSGGWVSRWSPPEERVASFASLLDRGFTVFAVRHGSAPLYKVPDAFADAERAARYVKANAGRYDVDPDRLGVWGGSAGGHLALMLGLGANRRTEGGVADVESRAVAAVVAYYPPVDLRQMVGPSERFPALDFEAALAPSVSPILFVDEGDPPTLLVHGDADSLVPLRNSQVMHEALGEAGVPSEFIVIPGGDHGFTDPEHRGSASEAAIAWFERFLLGPGQGFAG